MRRLLILLVLACPSWTSAAPLTTITGTYMTAAGGTPNGTIIVSWQRFQNADLVFVPAGRTVYNIVNGVIPSVQLYPNDANLPRGGCYTIQKNFQSNAANGTVYWTVPSSGSPVNVTQIEGTFPCTTSPGANIAPSQITVPAGTPIGYVLAFNGQFWAPAAGGGGGGGSPGGTNGQLQFNNLGAFGGFTLGGDCTLSRPNLTCTKTNGVSFAASATTDTTNAANISSGLLAIARGSTGTGTTFVNGAVVLAGAGGAYTQDSANFTWDAVHHCMSIGAGLSSGCGVQTPIPALYVIGAPTQAHTIFQFASTSAIPSDVSFTLKNDAGYVWSDIVTSSLGGSSFQIQDNIAGTVPFYLLPGAPTNSLNVRGNGDVLIGGATDGTYRLDVQKSGIAGTARFYDPTGMTNMQVRLGAGQGGFSPFTVVSAANAPLGGVTTEGGWFLQDPSSGNVVAQFKFGAGLEVNNANCFAFSGTNQSYQTVDTALCRNMAGRVEINNGTAGTYRDLILRNLTVTSCTGCGGGGGFTPYTQVVASQTSVSISAATHGQGTIAHAFCFDSASPANAVLCSYTRDTSGNLAFIFNPSFSGTIQVEP